MRSVLKFAHAHLWNGNKSRLDGAHEHAFDLTANVMLGHKDLEDWSFGLQSVHTLQKGNWALKSLDLGWRWDLGHSNFVGIANVDIKQKWIKQ